MKLYLFYPFILVKDLSYESGRLRPEETVITRFVQQSKHIAEFHYMPLEQAR